MSSQSLQTPRQHLHSILTPSDNLSVNNHGVLCIEQVDAISLTSEFGSPLQVVSEATLRANYRRIRNAFAAYWPRGINIMYAIKANTNLAIRAILNEEGAGGDCFSEGELYATFKAGASAEFIALNGSLKTMNSLRIAVERGCVINIDAEEEIGKLITICQELETCVRVNIRLKPLNEHYNEIRTDYFGGEQLADHVRRTKWGFSTGTAIQLMDRINNTKELKLAGFSFHVGRVAQGLDFLRHYGRTVGRLVTEIHHATGFVPRILDIGGGWARERDPESKSLAMHSTTVESCAETVCSEIRHELESARLPIPDLWVEPGRYIVGNAAILLTTVGAIKKDIGLTWVNIDAGTNELPRIDTSGSAYHVLAATRMDESIGLHADVVGPICADSLMGRDVPLPDLHSGDIIAILDTGMYSESASTQFNSIPRPATVLVSGDQAELIKSRETISDVFRHHRIPDRLQPKQPTA